ncbi:MAG: histidine phosphatase family protein [Elusimicrobiota bacterium]|nr:histidine phosphatase family protein [Elusimicrobiota bacterium]
MRKTILTLALITVAALACAAAAFAAPAQVIIIRHAEKNEYGSGLSEQGFRRAAALVKFFQTGPAVTRCGTPAAIYAAAPKNEDSSIRSIQTVAPLALALRIDINANFTRGQTHKLAREIMENPAYEGRMVLISWQHGNIPNVIRELAEYNNSGQAVQNSLPYEWPDEAFDRAWILDLSRGRVVSFKDVPQRLLPGDSFK